jgi:glucose-1-phosphate thymidylyltransferase
LDIPKRVGELMAVVILKELRLGSMIALILAAGYGTRLPPELRAVPKALLAVRGTSSLDLILSQIATISAIHRTVIVSNSLYRDQFSRWVGSHDKVAQCVVLDDGTCAPDERLGAVGDVAFAIRAGLVDEDVMVLASDCYFTFPLSDFYEFATQKQSNCIVVKEESDPTELRTGATVTLDHRGRVVEMVEKPQRPESLLGACPFYVYTRDVLPLFEVFLSERHDPDSPGRFPEWLHRREDLFGYALRREWDCFDIGTPSGYRQMLQ